MSDHDVHWIESNDQARKAFWSEARKLGDADAIHALFGVESMKDYPGTPEQAMVTLAAVGDILAAGWMQQHHEATVLGWTKAVDAHGFTWSFTIRQGSTGAQFAELMRIVGGASDFLVKSGWIPYLENGNDSVRHVPAPFRGIAPDVPQQETVTPPPPPPPSQDAHTMQVEAIDYLKVTAPSGKPQIEFWRDGRKYPEVKWQLGAEELLKIAPSLAAAGYTLQHLDAVGFEVRIALEVAWVPSPKNPKWKDITAVKVVGS